LKQVLLQQLIKNNYTVIYANTIISIPLASELIKLTPESTFIVHVHELNVIIKQLLPNLKDYLPVIDHFIVPSKLVKTNLIAHWSVHEHNIEVVHECTTVEDTIQSQTKGTVFTVGASGYVHWRKGHDVFLQLARYITLNYPDAYIKFVWVGKVPLMEQIILEADIQKLGLQDVVVFTGELEDPSSYYNIFDVFVLPSREDPFPLVCIEVGMLGKPIISFEQATGTNEIIEKGGGFVVPYLNIEVMAKKIIEYYGNPDLVKAHGDFNKVAFSKFTPEHICPQLFNVIEKQIN
jgi:glycosyltransferase involved in cell wall biosynthesis